jgi:hypothetical protein
MSLRGICIVLFGLFLGNANSQTCCSGGIPLSNNIGLTMYEKGTTQLSLNYDYNNLNTLNNGTEVLDDNSRLRITHSILVNMGYAISDNFSAEALFTWVNQRRRITQFGNETLDQSSGVGDGVLLFRYDFSDLIAPYSSLNIGIGTKIPLGSSTETNEGGIVFNADLQPGSNAWDLIYWASYSKNFNFRPSLNISSRIIYRSTGTNNSYFGDSRYKFGNEIQSFVGFTDQFMIFKTLASPGISFKYRKAQADTTDGFELTNTGGNWVSIVPNISFELTPNLIFSTKAELPLYSNVEGTQLTPTFRITSGILIKLPVKSGIINLN